MEEEKIILDRKSFEALAVDSRVKILKSLKERRKTLSEIAKEQELSVSGTKEHLETLEKVGLIVKKEEGHKWKYYELTKKGREIVAPRELRVWILLSISIILLAGSMLAFFSPPTVAQSQMAAPPAAPAPEAPQIKAMAIQNSDGAAAEPLAFHTDNSNSSSTQAVAPAEAHADTTVPLIVAVISTVTILGCIIILFNNRKTTYP